MTHFWIPATSAEETKVRTAHQLTATGKITRKAVSKENQAPERSHSSVHVGLQLGDPSCSLKNCWKQQSPQKAPACVKLFMPPHAERPVAASAPTAPRWGSRCRWPRAATQRHRLPSAAVCCTLTTTKAAGPAWQKPQSATSDWCTSCLGKTRNQNSQTFTPFASPLTSGNAILLLGQGN